MNCPLCAAKDAALLTERKRVPILQNLLCPTEKNALQIPRGQIALYMCKNCQFAYNSAYEQLTYDTSYENNQSHSNYFAHYLESEIKHIAEKINASPKTTLLLETGCGQGDFLKKVVENLDEQRNWQAIGFDPAYHGKQTNEKDRCRFIRDYFRANSITKPYERILCLARHVIEHIPDPKFLLAECNRLPAKEIQLFLETPDFNWILHQGAFEDIVYEHCSFFNPTSIKILLHTFGFEIQTLQNTFGGQYMWIEAKKQKRQEEEVQTYQDTEKSLQQKWRKTVIEKKQKKEHFVIWGGGAKAVAFLNLIDAGKNYIDKVIDINPVKQGNFLPGTGHQIVGPAYLRQIKGKINLLVMNENYLDEIKKCVKEMGIENKNMEFLLLR